MSHNVECYHCKTDIDRYLKSLNLDVSDWYYNNDLYRSDDTTVEVRCPKCNEKFFVSICMVQSYDSDIEENWELNND